LSYQLINLGLEGEEPNYVSILYHLQVKEIEETKNKNEKQKRKTMEVQRQIYSGVCRFKEI